MARDDPHKWDIFLSYSHRDARVADGAVSWIVAFERELRNQVETALGDDIRLFRDMRDATGADTIRGLTEDAGASAIFVGVGSPSFLNGEYTKAELEQFITSTGDISRLFIAEAVPLLSGGYPPPITDKIVTRFHRPDEESGASIRAFNGQDYYRVQITKMGQDIARTLRALRQETRPQPSPVIKGRGSVVVAYEPDLANQVAQVESHLQQFGVEVISASRFPRDPADFRAECSRAVKGARIFVQLLSASRGPLSDGLGDGYAHLQHDLARQAGARVMQWRSPDVDVSRISDGKHRAFVDGDDVIVSSLNSFIGDVRAVLDEPPQPDHPPSARERIFISHDRGDEDVAKDIVSRCATRRIPVFRSLRPGSERMNEHLDSHYKAASKILLLFGDAPYVWVESQLDMYHRASAGRETEPEVLALCVGPPPEDEKGFRGFIPGLKCHYHTTGWSVDEIMNLLYPDSGPDAAHA